MTDADNAGFREVKPRRQKVSPSKLRRKAERLARNQRAADAEATARMYARDGWDVTPAGEIDGVPQFVFERDGELHPNRVAALAGDLEERFGERARLRSGAPKVPYFGATMRLREDR